MISGQIVSGKYRLNQLLGSGGMADVWSATNTFTDREFAIKFMHDGVAKTQEAVDRFLQEAKVSARINHPNVIEIIDVGQTDDGKLFLVMELLAGMSLETALRKQNPPMTLTELSFVMIEVARALSAAHRCGVIHRDLKPSNIYLHKDRQGNPVPKVLDFGVSKFLEDERSRSTALTVQGTVLGSPLYMSPEQARGEVRVDGRSDIFSFGAILFEATCGFRAFDGNNFNALIVQIATGKPKSIDECAPHLPEGLRAVVRKCLETERVSRPANFDIVANDLMNVLPELEAENLHVPAPPSGVIALDPDATNALPVIRASDRPPASAPAYGGVEVVDTPEMVSLSRTAMVRPRSSFTPNVVLASGLVFFSAVILAAVAYAVFRRTSETPANAPPQPTVVVTSAPSSPSAEVTGVRTDALPKAQRKGLLSIVAKGPACFVALDKERIGKTPLSSVEISPGSHQLECTTADGKIRSVKLNIQGGASDTYTFETK